MGAAGPCPEVGLMLLLCVKGGEVLVVAVCELGEWASVVFDVGDSGGEVSSPGFCGGWFIWMWWWLVVPGGRRRVPRRFRARWGCACRWRSEGGWCPYQWTHSAVATTGGVDVLPRAPVTDQLGLVQRVECLSQRAAERSLPGNPPRQLPRSRPGLPRRGWTCTARRGRK